MSKDGWDTASLIWMINSHLNRTALYHFNHCLFLYCFIWLYLLLYKWRLPIIDNFSPWLAVVSQHPWIHIQILWRQIHPLQVVVSERACVLHQNSVNDGEQWMFPPFIFMQFFRLLFYIFTSDFDCLPCLNPQLCSLVPAWVAISAHMLFWPRQDWDVAVERNHFRHCSKK